MEWGSPEKFDWLKWVALASVLTAVFEYIKSSKVKKIVSITDGSPISTLSPFMRFLKLTCLYSAIVLLIVSLAEPQIKGNRVQVSTSGVDIVIAMDVSDSMLVQDVRPNRLEKAKLELRNLIDIARGDRIGVVAFAGEAIVQVPLTIDLSAVKIYLRALDPASFPVPGTSIEKAILTSAALFDDTEGEKAIVLLTDGEDSGGDPVGAARKVSELGVRVFTIGLGTSEGDVIRVGQQFKRDRTGKTVVSKLDEKTLQQIAEVSEGRYFRSKRGLIKVRQIYEQIRKGGKKKTGDDWTVQYEPQYQRFVLPAFILLLLHLLISESRRRRK